MAILQNDWQQLLEAEFSKPYYLRLREFLKQEYHSGTIYPEKEDIFNALHFTSFNKVKVVILGQDPYYRPGQAHGLSFSVKPGVTVPPSLKNIYKELHSDLGCPIPKHGYLKYWADQGVLLLNAVLTVRAGSPNSHQSKGWEQFTNKVIRTINDGLNPVVFLLWGRNAQDKQSLVTSGKHLIIRSPHPSPLSAYRGFFGSKPFSRTNSFLQKHALHEIDWQIPELN